MILGAWGAKDPDIIPLLHRHRKTTFFTLDKDFFDSALCHQAYSLVWLDVRADDAAHFTRRFLKHPRFDAQAKRMAIVARVHHEGIDFWLRHRAAMQRANWMGAARSS
jgi:predicted nuclease of predicted toxin-antitoxin system